MPIKLKRTAVFSEQAEQGQLLHLDDSCLKSLCDLDRTVCDANYGRTQPDSPFQEIDEWFNDGQYWSDAYNARWNLAVALYYLATHPGAYDFGRLLASSLDYRDNWSEWSHEKKSTVADTLLQLWCYLLEQPPGEPIGSDTDLSWSDSFAGRIFDFANAIELLDRRFFEALFQADVTSEKFFYECRFVAQYRERISDPHDPWMQFLPPQGEIRDYLQRGFFEFPEHEEVSSLAEQYIAWKATGCRMIDK